MLRSGRRWSHRSGRSHQAGGFRHPQGRKTASPALAAELSEFCKSGLAPYKYPRWINFVAELPKTATGKIQRFLLRQNDGTAPTNFYCAASKDPRLGAKLYSKASIINVIGGKKRHIDPGLFKAARDACSFE